MSRETNNLKLFKYDPTQDQESTFNIDEALNNNWDKIDGKTIRNDFVIENGDFNDIKTVGVYTVKNAISNKPSSNSNNYSLIVLSSYNSGYLHQIAIKDVTKEIYIRYLVANSWVNWTRIPLSTETGDINSLNTANKTDLVNAVNEIVENVNKLDLNSVKNNIIISQEDFNNIRKSGFYTMRLCSNAPNTIVSYWGLIVTNSFDSNYVQQIAIEHNSRNVYIRYYTNSSWSGWTQIPTYIQTGDINSLNTTNKSSLVNAINEVNTNSIKNNIVIENADFNNIKTVGIYTIKTSNYNRPNPSIANYSLIVTNSYSPSYIHQIAIQDETQYMYIRYFKSTNWSEWIRLSLTSETGYIENLTTIDKSNLVNAINEVNTNSKNIITKNITIPTTNWKSSTVSGFVHYAIIDSNITPNDVVDINIHPDDIMNGLADDIISSTFSGNGFVYIYSKKVPSSILIATMVIQKKVI